MTARGRGLVVAAVVLWVVARSFGIPQLHMAAVAALLLLAGSALWVALRPVQLAARRMMTPARAHVGATVAVHLRLQTPPTRSTPPLRLRDQTPAGVTPPIDVAIPALGRGTGVTSTHPIVPTQRGRHRIGPGVVDFSDPFGLVVRRRSIAPPSDLIVYPKITALAPGLPLGGGVGRAGTTGRLTASVGDELADIREYVRGDDLRAVHWPSTARRGVLMVRRDEIGGASSTLVLLDRRMGRHRGAGPDSSFECAVSVTASIGAHLAGRGRSVVVLTDPVAAPPPPRPWAAVLDDLAGLPVGAPDVRGLLRQVAEGAVDAGTLVAVMTVPSADELRELVHAGERFAVRAMIVIDPSSFTPSGRPTHDPAAQQAVNALRIARWRATVLRRGEALDHAWQQLIATGPSTSPGTS